MAYNRRSGGGGGSGYGGYGSSSGGYGGAGGARYNSAGAYRAGGAGSVNPWQSSTGAGSPLPRQPQQAGHHPPAQIAMALSKLLTTSNTMPGSGYGGGPTRSGSWGSSSPRMSHLPMRQRQDGAFSKDNRRRGGDPHNRFSGGRKSGGGGTKDGDKRKSAGKVNDENKKGQNERERTKEQLDADKKASYVGVPSAVLYCHVCFKHMWDSESFEKHVRGRPHELMMTYLDETYRMRVDFMRHQIKAVENQREIDLERVTNNKNKSNSGIKNSGGNSSASKPLLRSYCPMCDVRFYGPLTGHRKSDRHRKLKQFLHPECKLCDSLFHTRLEMDEHKLTAGHLKKVAEVRIVENPHLKDDEFDLIDMIKIEEEEQQDRDQMPVAKKYEMLGDRDAKKLKLELEGASGEKVRTEKKNSSGTDAKATVSTADAMDDTKMDEDNNEKKEEEMETSDIVAETSDIVAETSDIVAETSDIVAETSDIVATTEDSTVEDSANDQSIKEDNATSTDLLANKDQVAAYDPNVAIGKELLVASKGFVCRLCNCFLLDEQRVSIHCQTAAHYINYTTMTKMKDATSGGKKRSIDQVIEDDSDIKTIEDDSDIKIIEDDEIIIIENDNSNGFITESVETEKDVEIISEEPAVKRVKLDDDESKKEVEVETEDASKMDTTDVAKPETVIAVTEITPVVEVPVVEEKPVEVPPPAPPVVVTTPTRRGGGRRGGRGGVARRGARR